MKNNQLIYRILAGTATMFVAATLSSAQASVLSGSFGFEIFQGSGNSNIGDLNAQADLNNPLLATTAIGAGTYTGSFNFTDAGINLIDDFLQSSGGTVVYSTDPGSAALSSAYFLTTTVFKFTFLGNYSYTNASLFHDDGASIYDLLGNPIQEDAYPTVPDSTGPFSFSGPWQIIYVAANGLPEVLRFDYELISRNDEPVVPLPAALPLLAAGLGGLGLLGRMKRRKFAA